MEMQISILIPILTWIPQKKLNSPPQTITLRDFQNQEYHFTSPGHGWQKNKKNNIGNCKASCVSRKRDYFLRLKLMQGKLPKFMEFLLSNHLKTAARKSLKSERYLGSYQTLKMEIFVKTWRLKAVNYLHEETPS